MKIAILTFYGNNNYGSALQMYALTRYLQEKGHDAVVFDFLNMNVREFRMLRMKTIANRVLGLMHVPTFLHYRRLAVQENLSPETLEAFRSFYDNEFHYYSNCCNGLDDIDVFLAGSDQVWNIQVPNLHYIFFMRFADKRRCMSYAASFGSETIPKYNKRKLSKYLSGIEHISVREDMGGHIVEEACGKYAPVVLDPVLLVGKKFWENRICKTRPDMDRYIFCYFLDDSEIMRSMIKTIKKSYGEMLCLSADTGVEIKICKNITVSPFEFVSAIYHANLILTDSFHATAFSLLFNKPFFTCLRSYKSRPEQEVRVKSILRITGTQNRYIETIEGAKQVNSVEMYNIDKVNLELDNLRKVSVDYLEEALS